MSLEGMSSLAIFSSPLTPVAFRKLTLHSWDRVRGVSGKKKGQEAHEVSLIELNHPST